MTIARGDLTPEQVREYGDALSAHYGERVAPVSAYCKALLDYVTATRYSSDEASRAAGEHLALAAGQIAKSALLGRMIYGGETLRTEKCPKHEGRWSGLEWSDDRCPHGCGLTGWLPVAPALPTTRTRGNEASS